MCERTLSDHTGTIRGLCECEGKVVSCSEDCTIKVWNPDGWSLVRTLTGHSESVNCLCVCMGRLVSAGDDGAIKLWSSVTW
jgi:F-box and WD-40 domain protein CDC4